MKTVISPILYFQATTAGFVYMVNETRTALYVTEFPYEKYNFYGSTVLNKKIQKDMKIFKVFGRYIKFKAFNGDLIPVFVYLT